MFVQKGIPHGSVFGQFYCTFRIPELRMARCLVSSQRETRKVTLNRFLLSFRRITFASPSLFSFFPFLFPFFFFWEQNPPVSAVPKNSLFFTNREFFRACRRIKSCEKIEVFARICTLAQNKKCESRKSKINFRVLPIFCTLLSLDGTTRSYDDLSRNNTNCITESDFYNCRMY